MDPISTVASLTALVGACATVSKTLNDLRSKYNRAAVTITAISAECIIMSSTFAQLEQLIQDDPQSFNTRLLETPGIGAMPLSEAFQSAIDCSAMTMVLLQEVLSKCNAKTSGGVLPWRSKARYIWSEADMRDKLETVRNLRGTIGTFVVVTQA